MVSKRFEKGDLDGAYQLGSEVLSELAQRKTPEVASTAASLRTLMDQQIGPAWYAAVVYWLTDGTLYSWDETNRRVIAIFSTETVSEFRPAPDGERVAIRSGSTIYVVKRDGSCMVKLDYTAVAIFGWEDASSLWLDGSQHYSTDGVFSLSEHNSPQGFTRK